MIGATENIVSARAVRPGDIVRSSAGITIEVNNTDAEGRLVLADCLTHARDQGAERLVDLATLTGGIVTTFGPVHAGLMGNDDAWCAAVAAAGEATGERVWRLPLDPLYDEMIKGRYGDIMNSVEGRKAHSITAAALPRTASPATCRGRTSTSPASPTASAARTRTRARRAGACGCWSSSPAPRRLTFHRPFTETLPASRRQAGSTESKEHVIMQA